MMSSKFSKIANLVKNVKLLERESSTHQAPKLHKKLHKIERNIFEQRESRIKEKVKDISNKVKDGKIKQETDTGKQNNENKQKTF